MDQSEALWIRFSASYPCAVKIAAGKINAVSGEAWTAELQSGPQDYVVVPGQPWLDGFSSAQGSSGKSSPCRSARVTAHKTIPLLGEGASAW